jgi:3-(3-hydroxy-phenyl)propionate hydroxylase/6-hydroxy-3-succinoylpyridine 3-monooxygenase
MTWPERFVATNLRHDFESGGYWQSTMVVDDEWGAVIVKITRDGCGAAPFMEDAALPEEPYLEPASGAYRHLLPGTGRHTSWSSPRPYKMHQRCAASFRTGRVLLGGDAAHCHQPDRGFGLTTGLFDAFALWPTLAAVILDGADPGAARHLGRGSGGRSSSRRPDPQACAYKDFVFHACGGGERLEGGSEGMRRMVQRPDVAGWQRLLFTQGASRPTSPEER